MRKIENLKRDSLIAGKLEINLTAKWAMFWDVQLR